MENKTVLFLAFISSIYSILYLTRGFYTAFRQWTQRKKNSKEENNRIARVRIHNDFMDHSLLTYILLALAAAMELNPKQFILLLFYFLIVKFTDCFGMLDGDKNYPVIIRNMASLMTLGPLMALSFFVLKGSMQQYFG